MSLTVKHLKESLNGFKDDAVVTDQENRDFIHLSSLSNGDLIMSTEKPIGYCNRSGGYVFPTVVEDYLGVVPELDENVDLHEITLPKKEEEENFGKFGEPVKKESKYKKAFDEVMCYFDSISDEEQPKLIKRLEKLGVI